MEKKESSKSSTPEKGKRKLSRSRSNSPEEPKSTIKSTSNKESKSSSSPYPECPEKGSFKIIHWNVNGLRPLLSTKELDNLIKTEDPDMICFNETKISPELVVKMSYNTLFSDKYKSFFYCPTKKTGYAGTAIFTKYNPISVSYGIGKEEHDTEGRVITTEFPSFYLISCYTPNSGEGLKRLEYRVNQWDKDFFEYIEGLKKKKDVILCGDLNVAHKDIDIYDVKDKNSSAGFTKKEKESFEKFLNMGYIDTFRDLHKTEQKFSFFTKRSNGTNMKAANKGWRLDYFIVNKDNKFKIKESDMLEKTTYNSSDHIPIKFEFDIQ